MEELGTFDEETEDVPQSAHVDVFNALIINVSFDEVDVGREEFFESGVMRTKTVIMVMIISLDAFFFENLGVLPVFNDGMIDVIIQTVVGFEEVREAIISIVDSIKDSHEVLIN
jgi:hypothetical protein